MPLIEGKSEFNYQTIYGGYKDLQRMVRKGIYKLIYYPKIEKYLLFDLNSDPDEMVNLAAMEKYYPRFENLKNERINIQTALGDGLPIHEQK